MHPPPTTQQEQLQHGIDLPRPSKDENEHEHAELERETCERRRGRNILVAVDHTPASKHAFDWAITHLCRLADTLHLIHVLPKAPGDILCSSPKGADRALYESTIVLAEKLAAEAYEVAMVKTEIKIVDGDVGKMIVEEATRINPIAVVMGTHCRGLLKSMLQGNVSEYCSHHCACPVVLVPPKELGDQSVL